MHTPNLKTIVLRVRQRCSFRNLMAFWIRHFRVMFFFGFLLVSAYGAWEWYFSLYRYEFSEEEKRRYIEQNFRETVFQEKKFRELVERLEERRRLESEPFQMKRNLFEGQGVLSDE